ncbi:MAG: hypothetical protein AAFN92_01620 [Bacteroidota bacterium]
MSRFFPVVGVVALLFALMTSCTEPITVGSDLVEGELANTGRITDLPFTTRVVRGDSLRTYDASEEAIIAGFFGFNFGRLSDDVAGEWVHNVTFVPRPFLGNTGNPIAPSFVVDADTQVDSIVMVIPIDTAQGFYGSARTFPVTLRQLTSRVNEDVDYYTNEVFTTTGTPINRDLSVTATTDDTFLYDTIYSSGDTVAFPHIRIPLSDAFVADFNARDTSDFTSEDSFYDFFPGVSLEPGDDLNGMISLRPSTVRSGTAPIGGFYFFYPDTTDQEPTFARRPFDLWFMSLKKDFSGSLAEDLLNDGEEADQLLVAGQTGALIEINFPDLSRLTGTVINQAEISFYQESVEGYSYDENPAPAFVGLYYRNTDGVLVNIEDRDRLQNTAPEAVEQFLGGNPEVDAEGNILYRPRFSIHLQRMIDGEVPRTIFLQVIPIDRNPARVVLSSPTAAERPATVTVTFTELD